MTLTLMSIPTIPPNTTTPTPYTSSPYTPSATPTSSIPTTTKGENNSKLNSLKMREQANTTHVSSNKKENETDIDILYHEKYAVSN